MQDVAQQERATAADAAYEDIFRQLVRGMLTQCFNEAMLSLHSHS